MKQINLITIIALFLNLHSTIAGQEKSYQLTSAQTTFLENMQTEMNGFNIYTKNQMLYLLQKHNQSIPCVIQDLESQINNFKQLSHSKRTTRLKNRNKTNLTALYFTKKYVTENNQINTAMVYKKKVTEQIKRNHEMQIKAMTSDFFKLIQENNIEKLKETLENPKKFSRQYQCQYTAKELCNIQDQYKRTALHYAALFQAASPQIVRLLVDHGANMNTQDIDNFRPLYFPNNLKVSLELIALGASIQNSACIINQLQIHATHEPNIKKAFSKKIKALYNQSKILEIQSLVQNQTHDCIQNSIQQMKAIQTNKQPDKPNQK